MRPRLVVNNAAQPPEEPPVTDGDLKALCQSALVRAAKKYPLRAVIILDVGDDTTVTFTAGLSHAQAIRLAGVGVGDLQRHLTD